jgi:hypothetical protein
MRELEKNTGILEELGPLDGAANVGGRKEEQLATGIAVFGERMLDSMSLCSGKNGNRVLEVGPLTL